MMADINVVMDKLQGFETADDLAAFFQGYGIKAEPRSAKFCAITQFVITETGLEGTITNQTGVYIYADNTSECIETYIHTTAMEDFVEKYDKGRYPDLVIPGKEVTEWQCCEDCGY